MDVRAKNVLTVAVALLLFAGFLVWAEGIGGDEDDNRLDSLNTTTTRITLPRSTTTSSSTTSTTALAVVVPTTRVTVAPTPTTMRRTTPTTRRVTTTTRRPTGTPPTTSPPGPNGRVTEASDNSATFVHNNDGTTSESATPVSATPGALVFKITADAVNDPDSSFPVGFKVELTNKRGRSLTFPDGCRVSLAITPSSGAPFTLLLDASTVTGLANNETLTITTTAEIDGYGSFNVTGSVEVDYGS